MLLFKKKKQDIVDITKLKSEEYKLYLEGEILKLRSENKDLKKQIRQLKEKEKHSS